MVTAATPFRAVVEPDAGHSLLYEFSEWLSADQKRADRYGRAIFYNEPHDERFTQRMVRKFLRERTA